MMQKGLIQVYTGEGKGKTTAACGLAIRAIAHNLRVCYIYFHKDPDKWDYGELKILEKLGVDIYGFARKHPHFYKDVSREEIRKECLEGLDFIKKIYEQNKPRFCTQGRGKYDILILDEINVSLRDGFLKEEEVLRILDSKPDDLELVLTGRSCPGKIIEKADLVSEIKNIKHPYDKGVQGRKGIEY